MKKIPKWKGIVVIIVFIIITLVIVFNEFASATIIYSSADSTSTVASVSDYMQVRLESGDSLDVWTRSLLPVFICFTDGKIKIIKWGDNFHLTGTGWEIVTVLNIYGAVTSGCR
jgi:hypothetical protein